MPRGAFFVAQDPENSRDILFQLASEDHGAVPNEQLALRDEIDKALTVIRMICPDNDERFRTYFRHILSLAQAGLVGEAAQPELASRALLVLKEHITAQEGGRIKNQYMKRLGKNALVLGLAGLILALVFQALNSNYTLLASFLFLWAGCMAGVWLSFGARKTVLRFEDLHIPEQDRMEPVVRLSFAGLLTMIIGLLFSTKAIVITVGDIETWHLTESVQVALLIGMLSGFSEQVLSLRIANKASEFLNL